LRNQLTHLIDIVPTCLEITGVNFPENYNGNGIIPYEGKSLVGSFSNGEVVHDFLFWEHQGNRAIRKGKWKLVSKVQGPKKFSPDDESKWELYDMEMDRTEITDISTSYPEIVKALAALWEKEALRVNAKPWPWPSK